MSPIIGSLANGSARGYGGLRSFAPDTAFESIATATASSSTITFTSIPSTYQHLQLRGIINTGGSGLYMRFNSDAGSNYATHFLQGNGSATSAGGSVSTDTAISSLYGGYPSNTPYYPAAFIIDIHDYANTSKYKTVRSFYGMDNNGGAVPYIRLGSGLWQNTNAISSIQMNNISFTGTIALYGIKGA